MTVIKIIPGMLLVTQIFKNNQAKNSHKHQFMTVIKRLDDQSTETSLSAIYDLEYLAQINPQYHWVIMDMLTNFVRNKSVNRSMETVENNLSSSSANTRKLIQAAITVIINRDTKKDPENEQIDFSYADLRGLNLQSANLEQTNLYQANLSQTNLAGANLTGAILSAANLTGANLTGANLHRANLYLASLKDAILKDALLDGANLREAKFTVL